MRWGPARQVACRPQKNEPCTSTAWSGAPSTLHSSEVICKGPNQSENPSQDGQYMSALAYINKLGGTISPQLNSLAKELWLEYMERSTSLKPKHLARVLNTIADDEP